MKIMIVEDDLNILDVYLQVFSNTDYEVAGFDCPVKALKSAKDNSYDVLITDYLMPDIDGLELAEKIKQIKNDIKIILISGHEDIRLINNQSNDLINTILVKPVGIKHLFDNLKEIKNNM